MSVTLSELMQRLTSRLSEADSEFFTDVNKIGWLNEAQDTICAKVPFTAETTWETTTIPGCAFYLLDEDCLQPTAGIIQPSDSTGLVRLDFTEADTMDGLKSWRTDARVPQSYTLLVVSGHKRPRVLVDDTDHTDIPAALVTPIIDYALAKAKQKDEEVPQAQFASIEYNAHLVDLQSSRTIMQYDQFNRSRAQRGIRGPWGRPWRPYSCTYRHTLEGTAIELYGIGV